MDIICTYSSVSHYDCLVRGDGWIVDHDIEVAGGVMGASQREIAPKPDVKSTISRLVFYIRSTTASGVLVQTDAKFCSTVHLIILKMFDKCLEFSAIRGIGDPREMSMNKFQLQRLRHKTDIAHGAVEDYPPAGGSFHRRDIDLETGRSAGAGSGCNSAEKTGFSALD